MDCPECGQQTRTLETRKADHGVTMRRRRECPACATRFTTFERRAPAPAWVAKRGGERQPFDAAKLRAAIGRAAHKRPVTPSQLDAIVERIAFAVERADGAELESAEVARLCLEGLEPIDRGAFLQFAGTLPDELAPDLGNRRKTPARSVREGEDAHSSPTSTDSSASREREESN